MAERRVSHVLSRIDATEEQKAKVTAIAKSRRSRSRQTRPAG